MPRQLVFLVGEGVGDIGDLALAPPYRHGKEGFLQPVIRRLRKGKVEFAGQKISLLGKGKVKGLSDALERKAYLAAVLADESEASFIVFVTDLDGGERSRSPRQRDIEIERIKSAIQAGVGAFQGSAGIVSGVPCRTIEAWVLADREVLEQLGGNLDQLPPTASPEDLWGKPRDPLSNHPKMVLSRVLGRAASRDDFAEIAERSDLERLKAICPLSFGPFSAEVELA